MSDAADLLRAVDEPGAKAAEEARTRRALLHMLEDLQRDRELIVRARREWVETVDSVRDPIMVHDAQFRITRCNRAYAERAGVPFPQIIGRLYWECFPRGAGPLPGCHGLACGAAPEDGSRLRTEEFALDTGEIFVSRAFPVHSPAGPTHFLHLFEEVTERRRAEEKLRLATLVVESSPSVLFRCARGAGWPILYVSSNVSIWGYDSEALTEAEAPLAGLLHPDDVEPLREILERHTVRNLERFSVEFRIRTAKGETRWVDARGYIGRDAGSRVLYYQGIVTDITDRKRTDDALRRGEAELKEAQRVANLGSWTWDIERDTMTWSEELYRIFGRDPGVPAPGFAEQATLYRSESWARLSAAVKETVASGASYQIDLEIVRADGSARWVTTRGEAVRDAAGRTVRLHGTALDITERRNAAEALARRERYYHKLIEGSSDAFFVIDRAGKMLYRSDSGARLTGYLSADVIGKDLTTFVAPESREDAVRALAEAVAHPRKPSRAELRVVRRGGRLMEVETIGRNLLDDPDVNGIVVTARDITERKRTEATLRESEQRLALATQSTGIGIWDWNVPANKLIWDAQMYALYGIRAEDFSGAYDAWQTGLHPEDRERGDAAIKAAIDGVRDFDIEFRVLWPNGEVRHIEAHAAVQRADDGTATRMIGVNWDITERKLAEQTQQFTNAVLTTQQETSLDGIYVVDDNRKMVSCNRRFIEMWGVPDEVMQTRSDELAIKAVLSNFESPGEFLDGVRQLYENRDQKLHDELHLKDGRTFDRYSSPMTGAEGKYYGRVFYFRDISASKAGEEKLRRLNRALRTLSAGNEALVRATDEAGLLQAMTHVLCEIGGYPVSFVAYALDDPERSIDPKECVGIERSALLRPPLSWADNERGQSMVGRAIRLGQTQLLRDPAASAEYSPWAGALRNKNYGAVLGLPLRIAAGERPFGAIGIAASETHAFDTEELKLLEELAADLGYGIANLRTANERRAAGEKLRRGLEGAIGALAATVETRDPYTAGHQRRVAELAAAIAREMGEDARVVEGVHFGALIHDIGKIQIPAEMLAKPTRLSKLEFEIIKTHAQAGYDILKGIDFPWPVAQMVLQHHERIDGTGYPNGAKGEELLIESRILAVADVVEAMSSHRPYRPGLGLEPALTEIESKRGTAFDARAVDACLRLFREKRFALEAS
jgi:PAS domain S-box-containing protein/putative nucleotidyltransferase with HDIG domain